MLKRLSISMAVAASSLLIPAAAAGQSDPQILFSTPEFWESNPINGALFDLGLRAERPAFPVDLLAALRRQEWDLVIIRWSTPYPPEVYFEILGELTAHVDRGGALMFSIAELDRMPEYWPLLGIVDATDLELPLEDIVSPGVVGDPGPPHPAFHSTVMQVVNDPMGFDLGDSLAPSVEAFTIGQYLGSDRSAIVLAQNGRVITNGQEWDQWDVFSGILIARDQLEWLLGCPADLDGDGELTVFDFFEFQNRFDSGGASGFADFDYDGRLDVFDFLEFFNLFDVGC